MYKFHCPFLSPEVDSELSEIPGVKVIPTSMDTAVLAPDNAAWLVQSILRRNGIQPRAVVPQGVVATRKFTTFPPAPGLREWCNRSSRRIRSRA